jgi:hypothetical protein
MVEVRGARPRAVPARARYHGVLLESAAFAGPSLVTGGTDPARRVHQALTALPEAGQARLGVAEDWKQDRTSSPTGKSSTPLASPCRRWRKSIPAALPATTSPQSATSCWKPASRPGTKTTPLPCRRTGPTWNPGPGRPGTAPPAAPAPRPPGATATATFPGPKGELFFGYYLSAATMTRDEHSPDVPGLARRMTLSSCALDPVRALVPVLQRMTAAAVAPALLRPAHQRRADLLHHQGSRRHHHRPGWCRLTGLSPLTPVDRLPAHHPQPAHP